jgi:hypothetical protein
METVCSVCTTVKANSKHGLSFQKLLSLVRREFKRQGFDLSLKSQTKKYLDSEEFYVNAYYDAEEDQQKETPIEVIIYHNFNKEVLWDQKHTTDLLVQIFDAVVHEYKHQRQSRKRKFQTFWERHDGGTQYQIYLQDPDELDAYALSIAIELCRTLGKYRALRYMPKFTLLAKLKIKDQYVSPNLNAYVAHFKDHNPELLKQLAKKVYVRLQKVDTDAIFV